MIIDFHVHINSPKLISQGYWDNWVELASSLSGRPKEIIRKKLPEFWDEGGEMLINDMDSAGITYSVISVLDFGLTKGIGEASYNILEINKLYANLSQKYPNRLIPFASVDPRRENAIEILKSCITNFEMKGVKLLPPSGFYPNERICYPIYEFANDNDLPVLVHTGPEMSPMYSKYGYPIFMDEVASDFPNLKIILGHAGYCWWPESLSIANNKPNIYLDISGWQPKARRLAIEEFYKPLRIILNNIGPSRVLFGSDWPALRLFMNSKSWVDVFKNPPQAVKDMEIAPSEKEVVDILGGSAAKILKITS